jgi:hypothetical protein
MPWTKEPDMKKDGFELTEIYKTKDEFEVNMPDAVQKWMNRKRKQQAVLAGVAMAQGAEKTEEMAKGLERIGAEQPQINYWRMKSIKMMMNAKKVEECGNFGAFAEIEIQMDEKSKKKFIKKTNGNSCNRYWLCPRCQMVQQQQHGNLVYEMMQEMPEDERYYFITLTAPNQWIYSADLQEEEENLRKAIKLLQSAFTKMTDCCPFKQKKNGKNVYLFDGFIVMLEISPKDSRLGGWNPHLHIVGATSSDVDLSEYDFVRLWTDAYNRTAKTNYDYIMMQILEVKEWTKEELEKAEKEEKKYLTEIGEQNETKELEKCGAVRKAFDFEANIGELTQPVDVQIAKIIKYSLKPNDRMLFNSRLHTGNNNDGEYGEFFENYDDDFWQTAEEWAGETGKNKERFNSWNEPDRYSAENFYKHEIDTTARNMIPYSGATFNVHKICYRGIFRAVKKRIEERKEECKERESQLPQQTTEKYLALWQPWKGGFYIGKRYAQATPKQKAKLFDSPKKKQQQAESTLEKELPETMKERIMHTLFGNEATGQLQLPTTDTQTEYYKTIQKVYNEYIVKESPELPELPLPELPVQFAEPPAKVTTTNISPALSKAITEPVTACNGDAKPPPKRKEQFENRIKRGSVKDLLF